MQLGELVGQSHLHHLNQVLVKMKPRSVIVTGPSGCGKSTYAEALSEALGGEWEKTRWVLDCFEGSGTILDGAHITRDEWSRLIEHLDSPKTHTLILVTDDLDQVPQAFQSRSIRVHLRAIPEADLKAFLESRLVNAKISYTSELLDRVLHSANGDMRQVRQALHLLETSGGDPEIWDQIPLSRSWVGVKVFELLCDGYYPEAKDLADTFCEQDGVRSLALGMLQVYSRAWYSGENRIKHRFPNLPKTTEALLKWIQKGSGCVGEFGSVFVTELSDTGIRVEDPRVVAARTLQALESPALKGLGVTAEQLALRSNPGVPVWEDPNVPMDPRIREQKRREEEAKRKEELKSAHKIPSSVLSESSVSDANPFGLRLPPPSLIPKGALLATQFAKLARAKRLGAEAKWDLLYKTKEFNEKLRAEALLVIKDLGGSVVEESDKSLCATFPEDAPLEGLNFPFEVM